VDVADAVQPACVLYAEV
jgi:hypothetical protein